jgi:TolB-like protein/Tfp pilus assembly protein PilF
MALRATMTREVEHGELRKRLRWMEVRAKLIDPQIAGYAGHIVRRTPDGLFVEFSSAGEAVRCAIELQRDISAVNATGSDLPFIDLRMAIVPAEAEGRGEGAALALQERTEAGGITVGDAVQSQIAAVQGIAVELLGPAEEGVAAAYRLVSRPLGEAAPLGRAAPQSHASVAVLPFAGTVDGHPDDYFTSGIVENIVALLARVSDLVVVSREATLMFRGTAIDLRAVGRQLAVRYVVTGAAERTGERLRLMPQLIDIETDTVLWDVRYEVPLSKLFDLQDRISRRIVRALLPNLSRAELRRVETKRPESFDAYDLVLKAMHCMQRLDREDFAMARALLEGAIEKDPTYAAAHTLLARWYMLNLGQGYSVREHAEKNSFLKAVSRAVELNPADAHALALLGHCKSWLFRDYDAALDCFERAFAASPNSAFAWGWSSPTCSYLGDGATAAAHAEHALRLSPYGPNAYVYHSALSLARYTNGDYEEAARWGRRTLAMAPRYAANMRILAASLAAAGKLEEAKSVGRALLGLQPDFGVRRVAVGYSYNAKERNLALAEHLRLAGLPE